MPAAEPTRSMRQHALEYAMRGWKVIPIWPAADGGCTCPAGAACTSPGKHPMLRAGYSPGGAAEAEAWWRRWPDAAVAIAPGQSGLVVVDVDPRNCGDETFAEMESRFGELPPGPVAHTGGGGLHYYLAAPEGVDVRTCVLGPGLELKGRAGYVVAPPSPHASGKVYAWDAGMGLEEPLSVAPSWLVELARAPSVDEWEPHPDGPLAGLLGAAFAAAGMVRSRAGLDKVAVTCPWHAEHTCGAEGDGSTVVFAPGRGGRLGWFHCSHAHCAGRGPVEALSALPAVAVTAAKRRLGVPDEWEPGALRAKPQWLLPEAKPGPTAPTVTAPEAPKSNEWKGSLRFDSKLQLTREPGNLALLLQHDPDWSGCVARDGFRGVMVWARQPPELAGFAQPSAGDVIGARDWVWIQQWFSKHRLVVFALQSVQAALETAAATHEYDSLLQYLEQCADGWDHVNRLDAAAEVYFGAEPTTYSRMVARWWLLSVAARGLTPGAKVDHVLVLEGAQGGRKTSALEALAGEWFVANLPAMNNKDALVVLDGAWIVCIDELSGMDRATDEQVKAFLTTRFDTYRRPYDREAIRRPRRCTFAATTNLPEYLSDATGSRRFWPLSCGIVRDDLIARDRDQLWGEAVHALRAGEVWYPTTAALEAELESEREYREHCDPWADALVRKLATASETSMTDALMLLGVEPSRQDMRMSKRAALALRRAGWRKVKRAGRVVWMRTL